MPAPWLTKIFGGLLGKADKIIDNVVTSNEEKVILNEQELQQAVDYGIAFGEELVSRSKE